MKRIVGRVLVTVGLLASAAVPATAVGSDTDSVGRPDEWIVSWVEINSDSPENAVRRSLSRLADRAGVTDSTMARSLVTEYVESHTDQRLIETTAERSV